MIQIEAQSGAGFPLRKGERLVVVDPLGGQVADLFCVDAHKKDDALSSGRSIDYNDTVRFTTGHILYAHSGNPMLRMVQDSCGVHDFLVTPCSLQMFRMLDPQCEYHPSCEENLVRALSPLGVAASAITTTFNIFMNVPVKENGSIRVEAPLSPAGARVVFEAERDLIVGLTACSHEGSNGGKCKPVQYRVEAAPGALI